MGSQGMERREVLRVMALAAAASKFTGFERWVFAHDHDRSAGGEFAQAAAAGYKPQFFSSGEYSTVERLADLIIPSDGSAGAREAGVSEFIDFMAANDSNLQFKFRYGLTWLDAHAVRLHGKPFGDLTAESQTAIVEHLAYRQSYRPGEEEGRTFFNLIREYTIMGLYTSRAGQQALGNPGLRFYSESPECPHKDDREHRHLPAGD